MHPKAPNVERAAEPGVCCAAVDGDDALSWSAHPLLEASRLKSASLVAVVLGVAAVAWIGFESAGYGVLTLGVLAGSLSRYFVPTRYRMDARGIETSHLGRHRRLPWSEVQAAYYDEDGVFLSPHPEPSRLDAFRGTYVRFGRHKKAVARLVRSHLTDSKA